MRIVAIFALVLLLLGRNRLFLLYLWVAASPILSNLIRIRNDNPFYGSYRIVDYVGYASGPSKHLIEILDFDRIVLILLFLVVMKQVHRSRDYFVTRAQQWLGLFAATVFVSGLLSNNVLNAMRIATDTFGLCYLSFVIGRTYFADPKAWKGFLNAILALGAILGCTCVLEYRKFGEWGLATYGDAYRVTGPFRYWETLGMAASLVAYVAWFKWVTTSGPRARLKQAGYLVLCLLMAYCVFRTQTRTIMLALALGLGLLLYRASKTHVMSKSLIRKLSLVLALIVTFLLVAPEWLTNTRFYRDTINREATKDGRAETYVAATRMFLHNPLTGIGLKNFQDDMRLYMSAREVTFSSLENTSCHSSYFVTASEMGLMGFIPLVGLIASAFTLCSRYTNQSTHSEDRAWGVAMLGMTMTFFMCGTAFDPFFDTTMQNQLFYMCLGSAAARMEASRSSSKESVP